MYCLCRESDSFVVEVHSAVGTLCGKAADGLTGFLKCGGKVCLFFATEGTEDIVYLLSAAKIVAYSNSQATVVVAAQKGFDVAEPVVATPATLFAHA